MSLLSVLQGVARRCNYQQPSTAIGNPDPNIALMLDAIQDTGDELVERAGWQALKQPDPATFTGDGTTPRFALPSNFLRLGPADTFMSSKYPLLRMPGPVNEENLLMMKEVPMNVQPSVWRVVENEIEFYPVLGSGEVVSYVYGQDTWVLDPNGNPYTTAVLTTDYDTFAVSERLLRQGAVWRWKMAKGFEYAEFMQDYETTLARQAGQESTRRSISMSRAPVLTDDTFAGTITDLTVLSDGNF